MKKMIKTDDEWRELLDHKQFMVTRRKFTEPPYSNEFALSETEGLYSCVGCGEPLFDSSCKFEHKCGWPCFFISATPEAVAEVQGDSHEPQGVEVICNCCEAHLGHVYEDGPQPSGLRYAINSYALSFAERETSAVQEVEPVAATSSEPKGWQPG